MREWDNGQAEYLSSWIVLYADRTKAKLGCNLGWEDDEANCRGCDRLAMTFPVQAAEQKLTRAVEQGSEKGFKSCAVAMDGFVKFLHDEDDDYAHLGFWGVESPDSSMFNTVTSEQTTDGAMLSSISGVKNAAGKCDVTFSRIIVTPDNSCLEVRDRILKDWKYYADLNGATVYEEPGQVGSSVILTPLKTGCLMLKHGVFFGLPATIDGRRTATLKGR